MKRCIHDEAVARAAGHDAGNRNMRKHGRKAWNDDDWNVAVETMLRILSL